MSDPTDYDSPWKEAIETYFEDFMSFFFPAAHAEIDWVQGYEFLDKELQQIVREAEVGKRYVDKLIKLWRDGSEIWVLVHIEVQNQPDSGFAERMYVYHYRIYDRYRRSIASMAILGDEQPTWQPNQFGYELWDCRISFQFPIIKLLEYKFRWQVLESSRNPFATFVMAHLKAQETRYDGGDRKVWKLRLTRRLYEQGYQRQDILNLFRFIDWLIKLPAPLEQEFWQALEHYEQEGQMPYITSIERMGIQKGILQNSQDSIVEVLETRFQAVPEAVVNLLNQIEDIGLLKNLLRQAIVVPDLKIFQQALLTQMERTTASSISPEVSED